MCAAFQVLAVPSSHSQATASAVSADGSVVVGWGLDAIGLNSALRWTGGSEAPEPLGELLAGAPGNTTPLATNGNGRVVVGSADSVFATQGEAFVWSDTLGLRPLVVGSATGASWDGSVIVGSLARGEAFRWTVELGVSPLGFFATSGTVTRARAVSGDGLVIVGDGNNAFGAARAFRWTREAQISSLGEPLTVLSSATSVNRDGSVVVGVSGSTADWAVFRWTLADGIDNLFPTVDLEQKPVTNGDGSLVVGNSGGRPVIWDATTRSVRDLADVVGELVPAGWRLDDVVGLSADGTTVVGNGARLDSAARGPWVAVLGPRCPPRAD
jgi:hypothetical protein